jgi:excisionase family DNA binding protein
MSEKPAVVSRKAAAQRLDVNERTIDRLIRRGRLKAVRVGRRMTVDADSLDTFVAEGGAR